MTRTEAEGNSGGLTWVLIHTEAVTYWGAAIRQGHHADGRAHLIGGGGEGGRGGAPLLHFLSLEEVTPGPLDAADMKRRRMNAKKRRSFHRGGGGASATQYSRRHLALKGRQVDIGVVVQLRAQMVAARREMKRSVRARTAAHVRTSDLSLDPHRSSGESFHMNPPLQPEAATIDALKVTLEVLQQLLEERAEENSLWRAEQEGAVHRKSTAES